MNQALDTLGNTKWRVSKRILGVIDRIWANGGCLAGLVDSDDVGTFKPKYFFLLCWFPTFFLIGREWGRVNCSM